MKRASATVLGALFAFAATSAQACVEGVDITSPNGGQSYTVGNEIRIVYQPDCPTSIPPCCPIWGVNWYIRTDPAQGWRYIGHTSGSDRDLRYNATNEDCSDEVRFRIVADTAVGVFSDVSDGDCEIRCRIPDPVESSVGFFDQVGSLLITPDPEVHSYDVDVNVRDENGTAVTGIRVYWHFGPNLYLCDGESSSGITDGNGDVTLSPLGGGYGASEIRAEIGTGPEYVSLTGLVTTRSPDYDGAGGDGTVNLSDMVIFTSEYLGQWTTTYHDYDNSGLTDVGDLAFFAAGMVNSESCVSSAGSLRAADPGTRGEARERLAALRTVVEARPRDEQQAAALAALASLEASIDGGDVSTVVPARPQLAVRPNPADAEATIAFNLQDGSRLASAFIYDLTGRRVRVLFEGAGPSSGSLTWDGRGEDGVRAASGVYFVKVFSNTGEQATRRLVLR